MEIYTIENDYLSAEIMAYGAIIKALKFKKGDVPLVVSFPSAKDYLEDPMYVGACVGRYAGRIRNYSLDGERVALSSDAFELHGGAQGWSKKKWSLVKLQKDRVELSLDCPQHKKGHPGHVRVNLVYKLVDATLDIDYTAVTDKVTPINPTQHSYFCFNGLPIEDHQLKINAKNRLVLQDDLLPTGEIVATKGDHFGTTAAPIDVAAYDDVFIVEDPHKPVAQLTSPDGKFTLEVFTDQKAVVIFVSSDFNGICFETQGYPDAPNFSHFPSTLVVPNEQYHQKTVYRFLTNAFKAEK